MDANMKALTTNKNPKSEAAKSEGKPNREKRIVGSSVSRETVLRSRGAVFGFRISDFLRISDFGFRISICAALIWLGTASLAHAKLNVVATTPDLGSIAREIGGDKIELSTLAKPTEDPHFVDAKLSLVLKLNHADVLIEGGAELESGWLPALLDRARNQKIVSGAAGHVACAQGIPLLEIPSTLDRSRGDIHASGNPHYLIDPVNARAVAQRIADVFCAQDAGSADSYRANLKKFTDTLDAKLAQWRKALEPYHGQQVVAYHNSWLYFANRFGLKIDLFLEPKPGVPPTPTHLAEVISKMKEDKVHVIIVDPYLNRRTAEAVAAKTGATVVDVTQFPGGIKGTDAGYIALIDYLVNSLARALAGNS
jgi:zinc/manganese transport system substrate-binding protein